MKLGDMREVAGFGGRGAGWMRAATLACLLLLTLLAVVQVAHVHPAATDADHCPICVVMHSAAPVAAVATAIVLISISEPLAAQEIESIVRPWNCILFNRPPPQVS